MHDPEVRGAIDKLALLTAESFHGYDPPHPREKEIRWKIQQIAKRVIIYGDAVYLKNNMQPLPMEALTIVENRSQIMDLSAQVYEANFYVLNELDDNNRQVFPRSKILHFRMDETAMPVYDLLGRYTFGVWSISPLETLKSLVLWKHQMLYTDILWRMRNVPREHHKLDLSMFSPDLYSGSIQERISKARQDAKRVLEEYANNVKYLKPDQGYITSKDVEITYVEPRSTNYRDPNELLNQISDFILSAIGIHPGAVKGKSASSYAGELIVKGYTGLVAQNLCRVIAEQLDNQLLGGAREPVCFLELDIDRSERVRQAAILARLGIMTINELRQYLGLKPIEGGDVIPELQMRGRPVGTPEEDNKQSPWPSYPTTPESRRDWEKRDAIQDT